jgi:radical SAM superfamily enzyme YgiQ (UPF0313 family)
VGGHLKVAPEHIDPTTLRPMKRPNVASFRAFAEAFEKCSREAGKEQYLVPYFISAHPGCDLKAMIDLAVFLKDSGYRPEQVQDFMPAPLDMATCMYYTGLDPMTKEPIYVARLPRDRKLQRALLQFFKPENYFLVRRALLQAGRGDLIGEGRQALIPDKPSPVALDAKRHGAKRATAARRESKRRRPKR